MNINFRQDEVLAIATAVLLLFTPLLDARVSCIIGASFIIVLIAARFIRRTGKKSTFNPDNSGSK